MENSNIDKKENKEPMTTKQKVFFGLRIAFNVVFYALIIFLFLFSIMNIRGGNGSENFPNIFGRGFLSVQSDSMERDESKKDKWPSPDALSMRRKKPAPGLVTVKALVAEQLRLRYKMTSADRSARKTFLHSSH